MAAWRRGNFGTWESRLLRAWRSRLPADVPTCRRAHLPTRSPADAPTAVTVPHEQGSGEDANGKVAPAAAQSKAKKTLVRAATSPVPTVPGAEEFAARGEGNRLRYVMQ